jgi:pSer/pThr/pTyr-binding forkhead associated (FHA) protein
MGAEPAPGPPDMGEPAIMGRETVTFQVLEGIDKGRIFRDLPIPVTIGREEGNVLRLNDERVSRFHSKVQFDDEDFILTDLESTNGTRVNGTTVQIRRLRIGDRVGVGRSVLLFGSNEEIASRVGPSGGAARPSLPGMESLKSSGAPNQLAPEQATLPGEVDLNPDFDLNLAEPVHVTRDAVFIGTNPLPPLPLKLSPSQAARLAEILDFLHQGLTDATEHIEAKEDNSQVVLLYADWQRVMAVQMLLARYLRMIAEPPEIEE